MPDFPRHVIENLRQLKTRLQALIPEIENVPTLKKETEEVSERLKSINEEMNRMGKVRDEGLLGLVDGVGQTGKALQSADVVQLIRNYNQELTKSGKSAEEFRKTDLGQQFQEQARQIEKLAPGMKGFQAGSPSG